MAVLVLVLHSVASDDEFMYLESPTRYGWSLAIVTSIELQIPLVVVMLVNV